MFGFLTFLTVLYQIGIFVLIVFLVIAFFKMTRNIEDLLSETRQSNKHLFRIRKLLESEKE